MKQLFKKIRLFLTMLTGSLVLLSAVPVMAAESTSEVEISTTDLSVDKESGEYSFKICVDSIDNYAGAEFGVICSQDVEVTSVTSDAGSITGPKEANGLVWFGFFDGENSFSGGETVTVEGSFEPGTESAIVIQDIKIYTVGEEEYTSASVEGGLIVNLYKNSVLDVVENMMNDGGISTIVLLAGFLVIVAVIAVVLIYKRKKRGEQKNDFKKCDNEQNN